MHSYTNELQQAATPCVFKSANLPVCFAVVMIIVCLDVATVDVFTVDVGFWVTVGVADEGFTTSS